MYMLQYFMMLVLFSIDKRRGLLMIEYLSFYHRQEEQPIWLLQYLSTNSNIGLILL